MVNDEAWLENEAWVNYISQEIEKQFPKLKFSDYKLTSQDTIDYNCVAWAAEDTENWWWPDADNIHYWPLNVPREETLEAFIQVYQIIGYEVCENNVLEKGFQKIAIYTNDNKIPTHVARQLPSEKWTSKLGQNEDIEHETPESLTGDYPAYGVVSCFMKKRI
jgi:hypothetical protein